MGVIWWLWGAYLYCIHRSGGIDCALGEGDIPDEVLNMQMAMLEDSWCAVDASCKGCMARHCTGRKSTGTSTLSTEPTRQEMPSSTGDISSLSTYALLQNAT